MKLLMKSLKTLDFLDCRITPWGSGYAVVEINVKTKSTKHLAIILVLGPRQGDV
jgi:hypothetical protein